MAVSGSERVRLDSWKEIAEYLGRDVRTVVRWEKEKGLPIHTVPGLRRRSVFAYADELDTWLAGSPQINGEADALSDAGESLPEHDELGVPVASWKLFLLRRHVGTLTLMLAGAAVTILALLSYIVFSLRTNTAASSIVDKVTLQENKIVAWNKNGEASWQYKLGTAESGWQTGELVSPDGIRLGEEYIVALYKKQDNPLAYWMFSSEGRLLWKFSPQDALRFGEETYSQPWAVRAFHHVKLSGGKEGVAMAITHHTWWPSIVVLLDEQGSVLRKFVNSGWITSLYAFEGPKGRLLAVGGANNARNGAAIAILDLERFAGSSPEAKGSLYECLNCEPGRPLKYFVLPRSELNIATGSTFNFAYAGFQGDRLIVHTVEEEGKAMEPHAVAVYEFSPELKLLKASFGDRYWDLHRKLETEGKIMHAQADCPDRFGPRNILVWDPQAGWKELHPTDRAL